MAEPVYEADVDVSKMEEGLDDAGSGFNPLPPPSKDDMHPHLPLLPPVPLGSALPVHAGRVCCVCDMQPIQGARYYNYMLQRDYCAACAPKAGLAGDGSWLLQDRPGGPLMQMLPYGQMAAVTDEWDAMLPGWGRLSKAPVSAAAAAVVGEMLAELPLATLSLPSVASLSPELASLRATCHAVEEDAVSVEASLAGRQFDVLLEKLLIEVNHAEWLLKRGDGSRLAGKLHCSFADCTVRLCFRLTHAAGIAGLAVDGIHMAIPHGPPAVVTALDKKSASVLAPLLRSALAAHVCASAEAALLAAYATINQAVNA